MTVGAPPAPAPREAQQGLWGCGLWVWSLRARGQRIWKVVQALLRVLEPAILGTPQVWEARGRQDYKLAPAGPGAQKGARKLGGWLSAGDPL